METQSQSCSRVWAGLLMSAAFYLVSFGPVCWVASRQEVDRVILAEINLIYTPILWGAQNSPPHLRNCIVSYGNLGCSSINQMVGTASDGFNVKISEKRLVPCGRS